MEAAGQKPPYARPGRALPSAGSPGIAGGQRTELGAPRAPQPPPRSRPGQSGRASPPAWPRPLQLPHSFTCPPSTGAAGSSLRSRPGAARRPLPAQGETAAIGREEPLPREGDQQRQDSAPAIFAPGNSCCGRLGGGGARARRRHLCAGQRSQERLKRSAPPSLCGARPAVASRQPRPPVRACAGRHRPSRGPGAPSSATAAPLQHRCPRRQGRDAGLIAARLSSGIRARRILSAAPVREDGPAWAAAEGSVWRRVGARWAMCVRLVSQPKACWCGDGARLGSRPGSCPGGRGTAVLQGQAGAGDRRCPVRSSGAVRGGTALPPAGSRHRAPQVPAEVAAVRLRYRGYRALPKPSNFLINGPVRSPSYPCALIIGYEGWNSLGEKSGVSPSGKSL